MESKKLIVTIPPHTDSKLGYLSNYSVHPFLIDEKRFFSVHHYITSKFYEDSDMYEDICNAQNNAKLKILTRNRYILETNEDGTHRKVLYDHKKHINKQDLIKNISLAVRNKFDQNNLLYKKIIDLESTVIKDPEDPSNITGIELMKIRDEYINLISKKEDFKIRNIQKDISGKSLEQKDKEIIDSIINIALIIKKKEGIMKVYPEMFEDALENIGLSQSNMEELFRGVDDMSSRWRDVISKTPGVYNAFKNIKSHLRQKNLHEYSDEEYTRTSLIITFFMRWFKTQTKDKIKKIIMDNIESIDDKKIIIPPRMRKYRISPPQMIEKSLLKQPDVFHIKCGRFNLSSKGKFLEKVILVNTNTKKDAEFLSKIGKESKDGIKVQPSQFRNLCNYIYDSSEENMKDKIILAHKLWVLKRISMFNELIEKFGDEKPIDLLGFKDTKDLPNMRCPVYVKKELHNRSLKYSMFKYFYLSDEEIEQMSNDINLSTLDDIFIAIDKYRLWSFNTIGETRDIFTSVAQAIIDVVSPKNMSQTIKVIEVLLPFEERKRLIGHIKTQTESKNVVSNISEEKTKFNDLQKILYSFFELNKIKKDVEKDIRERCTILSAVKKNS